MNRELFSLSGKRALVTGAGGGIGFTLALGLGEAGAEVVISGRNREKLKRAVEQLESHRVTASWHSFDVTDGEQVATAIAQIESERGDIDILVNNAGINERADLAEVEESSFRRMLDVHITGAFLVGQQVARRMIKRGNGKIVNVCSLMSELGRPTVGPYTAAKGGLKMLTKAMAVDWAKHNIQINGIGPGYFITDMTKHLSENEEFDSWLKKRTPANRWGDPKELVGCTVFLASDASNFVNGQVIYVDGGILASL